MKEILDLENVLCLIVVINLKEKLMSQSLLLTNSKTFLMTYKKIYRQML